MIGWDTPKTKKGELNGSQLVNVEKRNGPVTGIRQWLVTGQPERCCALIGFIYSGMTWFMHRNIVGFMHRDICMVVW